MAARPSGLSSDNTRHRTLDSRWTTPPPASTRTITLSPLTRQARISWFPHPRSTATPPGVCLWQSRQCSPSAQPHPRRRRCRQAIYAERHECLHPVRGPWLQGIAGRMPARGATCDVVCSVARAAWLMSFLFENPWEPRLKGQWRLDLDQPYRLSTTAAAATGATPPTKAANAGGHSRPAAAGETTSAAEGASAPPAAK